MINKEQNLNESTEAKTGVNTVLGAVISNLFLIFVVIKSQKL